MRDEKEERKKQARSNKQQGKATQLTQVHVCHCAYMYTVHVCVDEWIHVHACMRTFTCVCMQCYSSFFLIGIVHP